SLENRGRQMTGTIARREFIAALGGVPAWPLAAHAQQPAMPVIGYLDNGSLETTRENVVAVHRGLSETGYVEGRNVNFEYRWAEGYLERLPALASDLDRRQVGVIIVVSTTAVLAAKASNGQNSNRFFNGYRPHRRWRRRQSQPARWQSHRGVQPQH